MSKQTAHNDNTRAGGGSGSVSAGSRSGYRPKDGIPVGSEGGADPLGQAPMEGDIEEEGHTSGPSPGSGA